ncbi:MAG: hypothetical protein AB7R89_14180 [Dehalococcoidia bacterium]
MPNRFTAHGSPIASYEGEGELRLMDGTSVACAFEAAQLTSGQVLLRCIDRNYLGFPPASAQQFSGRTTEDYGVVARGLAWVIDLSRRSTAAEAGSISTYASEQLTVTLELGQDIPPQYAAFGLTNFDFRSWQRSPLPFDTNTGRRVLHVAVRDNDQVVSIVIRPLARQHSRHRRARALRSIEVTSELVLQITPEQDLGYATTIARDVSDLLSFARGTPVTIAYRYLVRSDGSTFFRNHFAKFAKPYVPYPLLDPRRPASTRRFLRNAFPAYRQLKSQLNLRSVLRAHLDARQDADFLQVRGVKIAAVAEVLKENFHSSGILDINDHRMDPKVFKRAVSSKLKRVLIEIADAGDISQELRQEFTRKLGDINRQDFREVLAAICRFVRLDADSDLQPFVWSRNRLIHTGRFISESTTEKDRRLATTMGWNTILEEYYFLVELLDRILLRLFDYEGEYVDISTWPFMANKTLIVAERTA